MEKKITLWAARNKYVDGGGEVWLYQDKPHCEKVDEDYVCFTDGKYGDTTLCFGDAFDDITFENSPVEVELTIKVKK